MELVSIIVAVYNCEQYISACMESIQKQTYQNLELILVDDGSTDHSLSIMKSFCDMDDRARVYHIQNGGVSHARNVGLSHAKGSYIHFVDADDSMPEDAIERMVADMETDEEIDLVLGGFYSQQNYFQSDYHGGHSMDAFTVDFFENLISFYYGSVCNKLYKTHKINRNGIQFDEHVSWCEDFLFNIEYALHCRKVYYEPANTYCYRNTAGSLTENVLTIPASERLQIELKRCRKARALAEQYKNHNPKPGQLLDNYIFVVINSAFNQITKDGKKRRTYQYFLKFIRKNQLENLIIQTPNPEKKKAFSYIKWCVKKKHYFFLYQYYRWKHFFLKFSMIRRAYYKIFRIPEYKL